MTFAILALDERTGQIGCAAATGNLAVGAWVLRSAPKAGAVATLGYSVSSLWGDEALSRLKDGEPADEIVSSLTGEDAGRDHRQLAVLDKDGRSAAWTGALRIAVTTTALRKTRISCFMKTSPWRRAPARH